MWCYAIMYIGNFRISVYMPNSASYSFCNKPLLEHSRPVIHGLPRTASALQRHHCGVAKETVWPTQCNYYLVSNRKTLPTYIKSVVLEMQWFQDPNYTWQHVRKARVPLHTY